MKLSSGPSSKSLSRETASVSRESVVLRSDFMAVNAREDLLKALQEDCREGGWRLCDPQ